MWDSSARTVTCLSCSGAPADTSPTGLPEQRRAEVLALPVLQVPAPDGIPAPDPAAPSDAARAGASAQREYERRSAKREQRVRSRHPLLGGLILALSDEPSSTRVWAQGARGERAVAAQLEELVGTHVAVLHDRARRRSDGRPSRANINHLAVAAGGVWVVDAKTHQGALEVRRSGGLWSPRVERLYIRGRDQTKLLDGLASQVAEVASALAAVDAPVPVRGVLCFVGTELPWFGESICGVPLVGRRGLSKLLKREGDLGPEDRNALAQYLATRFPPAS